MRTYISDSIDQLIKGCKTGVSIQRLWRPTDMIVVTEDGNKLVENNTDRGVIGIFIEEFYGSEIMERYLVIGIGMDCSLIKSCDCKTCPAYIYHESLLITISLANPFKGIPAFATIVYRNVDIKNLEDISIF